MKLPYDPDLQKPEALLDWIKDMEVEIDIQTLDRYPTPPLVFSEYYYDPPQITIYRYLPMEDWLNLMSQHYAGYYGPWYFLHIAYRFYFHLEMNGDYEVPRTWLHQLFGVRNTIEKRAYYFTHKTLGTLFPPQRFDGAVERCFQPWQVG